MCFMHQNCEGQLPAEVGALTHLEILELHENPELTVHMATVANLTKLLKLDLENTQAVGDLQPLSAMEQMQSLYLGNTKVGGNMGPLPNMTKMRDLSLKKTKIDGNVHDLQAWMLACQH